MNARLTQTQVDALSHIVDGRWHAFGSGMGKYRVALRALYLREPKLIEHKRENDEEFFRIRKGA